MQPNNSLKPTVYACHAFCKKANHAPRYGGLVPPFHSELENLKIGRIHHCWQKHKIRLAFDSELVYIYTKTNCYGKTKYIFH